MGLTKEQEKNLIDAANAIRKQAYSPYSKFQVGCAILLKNGEIICGVNIENASFPATICAEQAAICQVVTKNYQDSIVAVAVVSKGDAPVAPCGVCRQVLSEFIGRDTPIILANHKGEISKTNLKEILPQAFTKEFLLSSVQSK